MSKEIKVGDLVQVVRQTPCCGDFRTVGKIFTVVGIGSGLEVCRFCKKEREARFAERPDGRLVDMNRLKRIPPLEELEGQRTEEKLREPVCT